MKLQRLTVLFYMISLLKILFVGFGVSFLGQLPLSNMNMIATKISLQEGHKVAWKFGLGVASVEIIYLRVALTAMDWVTENKFVFTLLGWLAVVLFLGIGIYLVATANKQKKESEEKIIAGGINRFLLGVSLSAINPIQIPFWFTWSISLVKAGVLTPGLANYNAFTIGAGIGTLAGIAIYIHAAKWAIQKMGTKNKTLNYIMGSVFILAALIQLYKIITSPWTSKQA
jgi:hypothetical protein